MTRAEERALEAYPHFTAENMDDVIKARKFFAKGYEQAEKDLTSIAQFSSGPDGFFYGKGYQQAKKDFELTWGDVQLLDFYAMECQVEESKGRKFNSSQEFFEEVLRRFNKVKEEKK